MIHNLDRYKFRIFDKLEYNRNTKENGMMLYYDIFTIGKFKNAVIPNIQFIMQCTGLKDKNGNLIYEGDVLDFNKDKLGYIEYNINLGCFCINTIKGEEDEINDLTRDFYRISSFEIIGNIYENEDLLKN